MPARAPTDYGNLGNHALDLGDAMVASALEWSAAFDIFNTL